ADGSLERGITRLRRRPLGDDQKVWLARAARKRGPDCLGHEGHDGVEEAEIRVERIDQGPPRRDSLRSGKGLVGQTNLRELALPVAELRPDPVVEATGHLGELVFGNAAID